ncbi:MAG: ATPase, T2SS/T4P/T4SS family [Nitrospirales bacterium]|nr:Flp pilus assembly complex ATPase component TadA [Nitrospirales bacterium]
MSMSSSWDLVHEYLKPIAHLFEMEGVSEIMVNGAGTVFIERRGEKQRVPATFPSEAHLATTIQQIANATGQSCDKHHHPVVDARLEDGSRVCGVLSSVSPKGHTLTIRLFPKRRLQAKDLLDMGSLNQDMLDFLQAAVEAKRNILLSGSTGSGKTTFLNMLTGFIPDTERIITVEDTEELVVDVPNRVSLIAPNTRRDAQAQPLSLGFLIRTTLRMNPDRIVVGEIRDAEAAGAFLQAINTGHNGCASTIHANHPEDALIRLQNLLGSVGLPIEFVASQVRSNIHVVIQLGKVPGRGRLVLTVAEMDHGHLRTLWDYDRVSHAHVRRSAPCPIPHMTT